jgi:FSR family fosmidomycin resistance protein-like MFS transporter
VLLTVPNILAAVIEPAFGLLADSGRKRGVVVGGGIVFVLSLLAIAWSPSFLWLFLAFATFSPGSAAFVGLSQATLMDLDPAGRERNMARWVLAGSLGVVIAPLVLAASVAVGTGWRGVFVAAAAGTVPLVWVARRGLPESRPERRPVKETAVRALRELRRKEVIRWLVLLQLTDLLGDVFLGYLALYMVDVGGLHPLQAGLAVAVWTGGGLIGDVGLIPLLNRVPGTRYLRWSAVLAAVAYPAFLLVSRTPARMALLAVLGLVHAGWYAIPQARLYGELDGASGTAVAIADAGALAGHVAPLLIGVAAASLGLQAAMWLLLAAPVSVLLLVPARYPCRERA